MKSISYFMNGRDNNFNLLRVLAAIFISYYHCYFMVLGPLMSNERYAGLYMTSQIVLNFFFIASGFLIALSFERRHDLVTYFTARGLRLLPGILVLALILAFVMGPLVTEVSLADYFSALSTWVYVPLTVSLDPDARLLGVFVSNVNPNEIDEALWTLRYEFVCYIGLAVFGLAGLLKAGRHFIALSFFVVAGYLVITYLTPLREITVIEHLMHFGMSFFIGTFFYIYRDHVPLSLPLMLGLAFSAFAAYWFIGPYMSEPLILVASAYAVFWLAFVPRGAVRGYNQLGDYSYGIYIYHFPIEQVLMKFNSEYTVAGLFITALPIALVAAVLSWHLIERPALSLLPVLSRRISGWLRLSPADTVIR
ncbi:MAG: acyltransferase [Rhodomicrobium sp.]|nr:MAG: acyltransferase [Rhodomicrobium sp.]